MLHPIVLFTLKGKKSAGLHSEVSICSPVVRDTRVGESLLEIAVAEAVLGSPKQTAVTG